ncbi:MAG: hypothetical protein B7X34_07970 [Acidobacteriia bacterium 12-62-4]|nr:MAG: hypothetical protein B7X34_07970 [Acidobacteriia bacterium 12-62-4]
MVIVVGLAYWGGRLLHAQISSQSRIPALTVTYQAKGTSSANTLELIEAYRGDGSKAISVRRDAKSPPIVEVIDVAARRYFAKDPLTRTYDEFTFREEMTTPMLKRPLSCEEAIGAGGKCEPDATDPAKHLGFAVVWGGLTIQGGPSIKIGFAPELGFLPLVRHSNGTAVLVATSIVVGEPDSSLFGLPPDYQKSSSSSAFMGRAVEARGEPSPFTKDTAAQFDEMQRKKAEKR